MVVQEAYWQGRVASSCARWAFRTPDRYLVFPRVQLCNCDIALFAPCLPVFV